MRGAALSRDSIPAHPVLPVIDSCLDRIQVTVEGFLKPDHADALHRELEWRIERAKDLSAAALECAQQQTGRV